MSLTTEETSQPSAPDPVPDAAPAKPTAAEKAEIARIPATDQEGEYATLQWDQAKHAFWYLNSLRERCYHEPAGERFGADGTMLPEKEEA